MFSIVKQAIDPASGYQAFDGVVPEHPEHAALAAPYAHVTAPLRRRVDRYAGEICLALGWSGDVLNAAARAREANLGVVIRYNIPKEGAVLFFDMMAIPADAPHPKNAHLFINYMLRPEVAARNSSFVHYASANAAAYPLVEAQVRANPSIFPPPAVMQRLVVDLPHSPAYMRELTRAWTRFKTGH